MYHVAFQKSLRSFPFIQTSEVLAQYHPFTHELNPWSVQWLCRAPFGLSLLRRSRLVRRVEERFSLLVLPKKIVDESIVWISSLKKHVPMGFDI